MRSIRYALQRVAAERELAEERNLLRSVINNLLDSIYVKDARGVYRLDNLAHMRPSALKRPEEVVGKTVFDFFPHDAAVHFQADDQSCDSHGEGDCEPAGCPFYEAGREQALAFDDEGAVAQQRGADHRDRGNRTGHNR